VFGFSAGIDQIFGQGANYTIPPGINFTNLARMFVRGFQYATGRGVDYRCNSARLGIERILWGHDKLPETLPSCPSRKP
jgi:hypothetical protein